jgi:hypothetical protein
MWPVREPLATAVVEGSGHMVARGSETPTPTVLLPDEGVVLGSAIDGMATRDVEFVERNSIVIDGKDVSELNRMVGVPSFVKPGVVSTAVLVEAVSVSSAAAAGTEASSELCEAVGGPAVTEPKSTSIEVSASVVETFETAVAERGSVAGVAEAAIAPSVSTTVRGARVLPAIAAEIRMRFSHPSE